MKQVNDLWQNFKKQCLDGSDFDEEIIKPVFYAGAVSSLNALADDFSIASHNRLCKEIQEENRRMKENTNSKQNKN